MDICERRDAKGLYRKARLGQITNFTGISSPYEPPENLELVIDTGYMNIEECVSHILKHLQKKGIITPHSEGF